MPIPRRIDTHPLAAVFRPRAVAVVGASRDTAKRGHHIVRALLEQGYAGAIQPVHPAGGELLGLSVASSIAALSPTPDLAVICTPANTVPGILAECGERGVRAAVVLAVGFRESGERGAALEREIVAVARRGGVRLVGPNTSGILHLPIGLNLIGMRDVKPGGLALLAQSGNLVLQLVTEAAARSADGFRYCIGVGNEADIGFHEYVDYLGNDPDVKAIIVHTEGFRDGPAFVRAAATVTPRTPVVVLKGGRSEAGSRAARSHTGALAGEYRVFRAAMREAGVIEVARTDELLAVGETLATQPRAPEVAPKGIAILSDGGGHGTLVMDVLADLGAATARLAPTTQERLRELLGPAAAVQNPVDLAGAADTDPSAFATTFDLIARDPGVSAVIVVGLFGGYAIRFSPTLLDAELAAARAMAEQAARAGIGLVVHTLYARSLSAPLRALLERRVPVIESLEVACRAAAAIAPRAVRAQSRRTESEGTSLVREPEARALLERAGVPLVPAARCSSAAEAAREARRIGTPVVLKAVSAIAHKSAAGGVALGVPPAEVATVFARMRESLGREDFEGVLVSPMLPPPVVELLVGARRDPHFGPTLVLGAGGVLTELMDDTALLLPPLTADRIREAIDGLRIGARVQTGDLAAVARVAVAVLGCLENDPTLAALEINPLFVYADSAVAVDARGERSRSASARG